MPGFFTDYANSKVLDFMFGGQAPALLSTWYVGLSLQPATRAGNFYEVPAMTNDTPPVSTGYARVAVSNNLTNFPAAMNGLKQNAVIITFPVPVQDWGTVYALFFADAATAGNVWLMSDLPVPRTILNGSAAPTIAVGGNVLQDS